LLAARASYIAGFSGTATVPAQPLWGIPITGTMAHSFVEAHSDEEQAFLDFARSRPNDTVFLIDTYDTEAAAQKVVRIAPRLAQEGITVQGVRIDSGDLGALSQRVRAILDDGGLGTVPIIASGGLDEWRLRDCVDEEVPIDGFGIGTSLTTSEDAPALNCAYKLQEYTGHLKRKLSEGKATWPGRKQVWRDYDASGVMHADALGFEDEDIPGTALLQPVMREGVTLDGATDLQAARERAARELAALPPRLQELEPADPYPVRISDRLREEAERLEHALTPDGEV
jgi:nicotinate phosphoribosyltransferase